MQFSITGPGSQTQTERGCDVVGLTIGITDTNAVATTQVTDATLQATLINVTLQRAGNNYTVMSGNLFALGLASLPTTYEGVPIYNGAASNFTGFRLDFGEIINLTGDDVLSVQITSGLTATGTLVCDTVRGVGIGQYIPRVAQFIVDQNMSLQTHNLGDNVDCISIIGDNGLGPIDISSVTITSSGRYAQTFTTPGLLALAASQWERPWQAATGGEGYASHLYAGSPIDGVIAQTNNVANTGNTWIVAFAGIPDPVTQARAQAAAVNVIREQTEKVQKNSL